MLSLGHRSRAGSRIAATRTVLIVALAGMVVGLMAAPARAVDDDPLRPPDTSSPRDVMRSFINGSSAAYHRYLEGGQRTRDSLGAMEPLRRAVRTLDLSEVPPALVDNVGLELTLLLKEVLDRIELPPSTTIPGDDDPSLPTKWTIPETEITIASVEKGPRAGEYLFTPDTVARVHEFYERVKHLPYQPAASERFYELYVSAPGWMIPGQWLHALPGWFNQPYYEQARWQWLALGLVALASVAVMALALIGQRHLARSSSGLGWSRLLFPVTGMAVIRAASYFIDRQINIAGAPLDFIKLSLDVLFYIFVALLIIALCNIAVNLIVTSNRLRPRSVDTHLVRVSFRIVMIVLIGLVILHLTSNIGIPITPVLAGLGVGGLAVALAAQSTMRT